MRGPVGANKERGPDPFGVRASASRAWRCAATRSPLPDASGPRSDQAGPPETGSTKPTDRPDAWRRRTRLATSSPRRARTQPDPSWVGVFGRCGGTSRSSLGEKQSPARATGADCKESLPKRQPPCDNGVEPVALHPDVSNLTITRRRNALTLFQAYAERELASGTPPRGLEQAFAARLQVSPSMWSQIKSSRPIGDKLARQIEAHCAKPEGWLDHEQDAAVLSEAEKAFLDSALRAWRATNSAGRKELRARLKSALPPE